MQISEIIYALQQMLEQHGDLVVYDSDDNPMEEVSLNTDNGEDKTITMFSEGDLH